MMTIDLCKSPFPLFLSPHSNYFASAEVGTVRTLNTRRLMIFREVALRGTIAAAAEVLNLTGPGISHQISALEREVGLPLFDRTPRMLRLNDAGRCLIRHSERILADSEAALAELETFSSGVNGVVRMSVMETTGNPGHMVLEERIRHPGLKVVAVSMAPAEAVLALRCGEIDIALAHDWTCIPTTTAAGTTRCDLSSDTYNVALPPSHPLASEETLQLRDLAHERWAITQDQGFQEVLRLLTRTAGFTPDVVLEATHSRALLITAEVGNGIGLVPNQADSRGSKAALVPLAEPGFTRHIYALVRTGSEKSPTIATVLGGLKEGASLSMIDELTKRQAAEGII